MIKIQTVLSVEHQMPGDKITNAGYDDRKSVLDYDLLIIGTDEPWYIGQGASTYRGLTCLSDNTSGRHAKNVKFWRKEIEVAFTNNIPVVYIIGKKSEFYYDTGETQTSGTGRNAKVTRLVNITSNYALLPNNLKLEDTSGSKFRAAACATFTDDLIKSCGDNTKYFARLTAGILKPLFVTERGNHLVGGYVERQKGGLALVFPKTDFCHDEQLYSTRSSYTSQVKWTEAGHNYGNRYLASLIKIVKEIKKDNNLNPQPEWVGESSKFDTKEEIKIAEEVELLENEILKLTQQVAAKHQKSAELGKYKGLLYLSGKPLEILVREAFEVIGFEVKHFQNNESEFDAILNFQKTEFLVEVEGKDNKAIDISKMRQLESNIQEHFALAETIDYAKGVLVGNPMRKIPLSHRTISLLKNALPQQTEQMLLCCKAPSYFERYGQFLTAHLTNTKKHAARQFSEALEKSPFLVQIKTAPRQLL